MTFNKKLRLTGAQGLQYPSVFAPVALDDVPAGQLLQDAEAGDAL